MARANKICYRSPEFEPIMNITWNGAGSITLTAKPGQTEVSLVTNPFFAEGTMKFPKQIEASMIVRTHNDDSTGNVEAVIAEHDGGKAPFVVDHAGEYEVRGLFATGISAPKKDGTAHTIYRFDIEGMHVGFLGAIDRALTTKEQESLGAVDILLVPAGGGSVLGAAAAAELVTQIEPRVVIPMYVNAFEGDGFAESAAFVREIGAPTETMAKYKITRSGLPEEDMQVVVLTRG